MMKDGAGNELADINGPDTQREKLGRILVQTSSSTAINTAPSGSNHHGAHRIY